MKSCIIYVLCIVLALYLLSRSILVTSIIISIVFLLFLIYAFRECWKDDVKYVSSKKKRITLVIKYIIYFVVTILVCLWIGKNSGDEVEEYDYVEYMMDKAS